VIKAFKRAHFNEYHRSGSHIQFRHLDNLALRITIPFHKKDLSPKTLKSILKQANLTVEQFIDLL
jgi:predicted RNA binding protein YcfA (HicA-like mRNA interferase family)